MTRATPPFHADPCRQPAAPRPSCDRAFRARSQGRIGAAEFTAAQDRAVREAVALQEGVGLQSITDGEIPGARPTGRTSPRASAASTWRRRGFAFSDDSGERASFLAPHPVSRLKRPRTLSGDDFDFLKSCTARTPKVTLPSPPSMHFWGDWDAHLAAGYADQGRVLRRPRRDLPGGDRRSRRPRRHLPAARRRCRSPCCATPPSAPA